MVCFLGKSRWGQLVCENRALLVGGRCQQLRLYAADTGNINPNRGKTKHHDNIILILKYPAIQTKQFLLRLFTTSGMLILFISPNLKITLSYKQLITKETTGRCRLSSVNKNMYSYKFSSIARRGNAGLNFTQSLFFF